MPIPQSPKPQPSQSLEVLGAIRMAALQHKTIMLEYRDSTGRVTQREAEPYKMSDKGLYAYAYNRDEIRLFKIDGIISARMTSKTFDPRWPIEIQ